MSVNTKHFNPQDIVLKGTTEESLKRLIVNQLNIMNLIGALLAENGNKASDYTVRELLARSALTLLERESALELLTYLEVIDPSKVDLPPLTTKGNGEIN